MRTAYPWMIWQFWVIAGVIGLYFMHRRWHKRMLVRFGSMASVQRLIPQEITWRRGV
ncbi:MAG: hypothetical protein GF384_01085, partial [Elusimicrobia bacterium]|nr:hypothetical protein [Elusimicrobiota bacterium]